jgi:hypothetical protein
MQSQNQSQNKGQVQTNTYSMYIPRISKKYDEQQLIGIFHDVGIGFVKRIDFIDVEKNTFMNGAFVHFYYLYDYEATKQIVAAMEAENGSYHLHISEKEFWILLKNKKPISDTVLNIHQIVDILKTLEEEQGKKIEEQDKKIEEQDKKITDMESKINDLETILLQIIQDQKKSSHSNLFIQYENDEMSLLSK